MPEPDSGSELQIRPAVPADNQQLVALLRQVAVVTPGESYKLERDPDAFALMRFQGLQSQLLVAAEGDCILGMVSVAIDRVWLDGEPREMAYSSEMRVLASARGRGLGDRLQQASLLACRNAAGEPVPLFNTVMTSNPVGMRMNQYLAQAGFAPVNEIAEVQTCFWPTLLGHVPVRSQARFRLATPADFAAMEALWQKFARRRQLARAYAPGDWQEAGRLPLQAHNWILAYLGDELAGFVGIWDQRPLRQIRMLNPSLLMRLFGPSGQPMPVGHCFHICLPERRLFPGLLQQALRQARAQGLSLLSLALDAQDPLLEWLPGHLASMGSFGRMHLCSNIRLRRSWAYHLEMALG